MDFVVDFFYPIPEQLESEMEPLLARQDIIANVEYEPYGDQEQEVKKAFVALKAKETFGMGATTLIGAVLKKQKCYERSACTIGNYLKDFAGKDVTFL